MKFRTMFVEENGEQILRTIATLEQEDLDRFGIKTAEDLTNFDQRKFWEENYSVEQEFDALWQRSFN